MFVCFRMDRSSPATNLDNSPIDVESTNDYKSPISVDSPPPMNLRTERSENTNRILPENPIPLRLGSTDPIRLENTIRVGATTQLTQPLRIRVNSPSRLNMTQPSPHTNIQIATSQHGGIVRIAPQSPAPQLHRPFSPARLS